MVEMYVCSNDQSVISSVNSCTALAALKKHYNNLWRSFPDDHMITLSTLCEACNVQSEAIEMITACRSSDEANRTILNYIIFITKGDQQIMEFCNLMQKLINNPRLSKITSDLRSGVLALGTILMTETIKSVLLQNNAQYYLNVLSSPTRLSPCNLP